MLTRYQFEIQYKNRERQVLNAVLALATGILTLVYPNFLYLIAGGYLVALGGIFALFKMPTGVAALPIVTGILIFIFPELIPVTFAVFLGILGAVFLLGLQFSILGALTLLIALLIVINPSSIAYLIAFFLLIYAVSNLIRLYQDWGNNSHHGDQEVSIQ